MLSNKRLLGYMIEGVILYSLLRYIPQSSLGIVDSLLLAATIVLVTALLDASRMALKQSEHFCEKNCSCKKEGYDEDGEPESDENAQLEKDGDNNSSESQSPSSGDESPKDDNEKAPKDGTTKQRKSEQNLLNGGMKKMKKHGDVTNLMVCQSGKGNNTTSGTTASGKNKTTIQIDPFKHGGNKYSSITCVGDKCVVNCDDCSDEHMFNADDLNDNDGNSILVPKRYRTKEGDTGYSYFPPEKWSKKTQRPPKCVTNNGCPVCPTYMPGKGGNASSLKEWNNSRKVTGEDKNFPDIDDQMELDRFGLGRPSVDGGCR